MHKETILITGKNGMLAQAFYQMYSHKYNFKFLSRLAKGGNTYKWEIINQYIDSSALENVDHILHLAGAGIADKRWTSSRKQLIYNSRIQSLELLYNTLKNRNQTIKTILSGSGIGYYGTKKRNLAQKENDSPGNDFLANVCIDWEKNASKFYHDGISNREIRLRFGIILDKSQGAFPKILSPIKKGFGAALGSGQQAFPWIHIRDVVQAIDYIISNEETTGVYNLVATEQNTNQEITSEVANLLNRKLFLPNVPSFVLNMMLGKMATMLTEGNPISNQKLLDSGFSLKFPSLQSALQDLI